MREISTSKNKKTPSVFLPRILRIMVCANRCFSFNIYAAFFRSKPLYYMPLCNATQEATQISKQQTTIRKTNSLVKLKKINRTFIPSFSIHTRGHSQKLVQYLTPIYVQFTIRDSLSLLQFLLLMLMSMLLLFHST